MRSESKGFNISVDRMLTASLLSLAFRHPSTKLIRVVSHSAVYFKVSGRAFIHVTVKTSSELHAN